MEINILLFMNMLLYTIITSQSFIYIIALEHVQKNLQANTYIEVRKLLDKNFMKKYTKVVYLALLSTTLLTVVTSIKPDSLLFITSAIAWVALIIDIILATKGNIPINKAINNWNKDDYPVKWQEYRSKWFSVYNKRQIINIIGFLCLLLGIIFG